MIKVNVWYRDLKFNMDVNIQFNSLNDMIRYFSRYNIYNVDVYDLNYSIEDVEEK